MKTMHCKRCSYTTRSLAAMGAHYRKKHPSVMKRHKKTASKRIVRDSVNDLLDEIKAKIRSLERAI